MVELIVGKKGKGKTKVLLDKVNSAVKEANGSIVYLDKSTKHMYELNNKVRLIDVSGFPIKNADEFVGFICGILSQDHDLEQIYLDSFLKVLSQDHDLEQIYLDSFLKVSKLEEKDITGTLEQLDEIGKQFNVTFVISVSLDKEEVPEVFHDKVIVAL
ncbi:twitching motility protein PilT [Ruminococcus sp. AM58-7XD]|nr:twitching motility protein PilT [Ruminococcus sp. AM58-7XD]